MFPFRKKKHTATKESSELKAVSQFKSLSEFSTMENELFKPYVPNSEFELFTLDEGLEVLVLTNEYCDKRVVIILRDLIHGKTTLKDATRTILDFLPGGKGSGSFGSCMMHTAMQIPYSHPCQARVVQLLGHVYRHHSLPPGSISEFAIMMYENMEPDLDDDPDPPTPGDPIFLALNYTAFDARLAQDGIMNTITRGIWRMRGLEFQQDVSKYTDAYVSMSALWIIFAGRSLYTEVVEAPVTENWRENALRDTGTLYKDPVYGRERWIFWRDMLKAAADKETSSEESRQLARNAAQLMDAIERSVQF